MTILDDLAQVCENLGIDPTRILRQPINMDFSPLEQRVREHTENTKMEITAKQLRAIEKSIGFDATCIVTPGMYGEMGIELKVIVNGEQLSTKRYFDGYHSVPFKVVAQTLVRDINNHIMNLQFQGAF